MAKSDSEPKQKEQDRQELHKRIWKIADDLRGAVDGWDFKAYVIGAMFYRFLSENIADYVNARDQKYDPDFDYARAEDADVNEDAQRFLVQAKGFVIKPSELFCNVLADARENQGKELNKKLQAVLKNIEASSKGAASEEDFDGLFRDFDCNSPKLGEDKSKRLLDILNGVDDMLLHYSENAIDAFGDAYEYLMAMYASNAGKSGGEFYTPPEVSTLLAKLATLEQTRVKTVYDPACGSGALLLKVKKELEERGIGDFVEYYGQEINRTTYNMCRINMILHNVGYNRFSIKCADTLIQPDESFAAKAPFDAVVSNPPYSIHWEGDENPLLMQDPRFRPAGVLAPRSKADLAFVMHSLYNLSSEGAAAIVCFPGVLYRGGAERKIRAYLVENNYVDAIIQLPSNLFYGTSIATCIMVLRKNRKDSKILFVDASREFVKVVNNNKLTPDNIQKIADAVKARADVEHFAKLVPSDDVKANDYNLSVSSYVEQPDEREKIDIVKLNAEISEIVRKEDELRKAIDKIVEEIAE